LLDEKKGGQSENEGGQASKKEKPKSCLERMFKKESKAETGPTVADTPKFRNQEIEAYEPSYYEHLFHIRNLRKVPGLKDLKSFKLAADDGDMINAQMMPHSCNGNVFTILFNYERASKRRDFEGRT